MTPRYNCQTASTDRDSDTGVFQRLPNEVASLARDMGVLKHTFL